MELREIFRYLNVDVENSTLEELQDKADVFKEENESQLVIAIAYALKKVYSGRNPPQVPTDYPRFIFKVMIFGSEESDKSKLLEDNAQPLGITKKKSIGVAIYNTSCMTKYGVVELQIWDMSEGEQWHYLLPTYSNHADGYILCVDPVKPATIDQLERWGPILSNYHTIPCTLLCGCPRENINLSIKDTDAHSDILNRISKAFGIQQSEVTVVSDSNPQAIFDRLSLTLVEEELDTLLHPHAGEQLAESSRGADL